MRRAVFFDRDGTLIVDRGYLSSPDQVEFPAGALEMLRELQRRGFALVVISNQSGIGRGFISEEEARAVDERFRGLLAGEGISLDGVYYCPHLPEDGCDCRKPKPGLLLEAARELDLDLEESYMVGDKISDAEAGDAAHVRPVLIWRDAGVKAPNDWILVRDVREVVGWIK